MTFRGDSTRVVHPLFQTEDGGSIPTSPLQLHVGRISVDLAIDLNSSWHSRLPAIDKSNVIRNKYCVCFGAEHSNVWYACAIWTSPIAREFNKREFLELRRFAIAPDAPDNTGSRMLKVMTLLLSKSHPNLERLVSYQDTEVHKGTIYAAAGWTPGGYRRGGAEAWSSNVRKRATSQASGDKVRWEKHLMTSAVPSPNRQGEA